MQTKTTEDYIKKIYSIEVINCPVTTSALAHALSVSDASANDMMKRLAEQGYAKYFPRKGVQLTKKGKTVALKLIRRHRLWEMFLVKFLGYKWDEIHNEAELLEHVTSDLLESKLDVVLGYPKVDPHGDPIPMANGELRELNCIKLSTCPVGYAGAIIRVSDESSEILKYIEKLGLGLNSKIEIRDKIHFDGSVIIKCGGKELALSEKMAQCIFVEVK